MVLDSGLREDSARLRKCWPGHTVLDSGLREDSARLRKCWPGHTGWKRGLREESARLRKCWPGHTGWKRGLRAVLDSGLSARPRKRWPGYTEQKRGLRAVLDSGRREDSARLRKCWPGHTEQKRGLREVLDSGLSARTPGLPRTVVHDKASYMVTSAHDRLQQTFAAALTAAGFCSWVGGASDSTKWLVKKWGDVYLHETVISHIRRLLDDDFACRRLGETVPQFTQRMHKVADYMNSPAFAATDGRGLQGLAAQLHTRCQWVVRHKGQRYPK